VVEPGVPSIDLTVRYGAITESNIFLEGKGSLATSIGDSLVGKRLDGITDWKSTLLQPESTTHAQHWDKVTAWLQKVLPKVDR
jgi:hypothetical protein